MPYMKEEAMLSVVYLIIGFVLLVKGADFFVDGSSAIAKRLGIPSLIIGLTIVAFGTSAPEAAVSITASLTGQNEIAVGNVIGSNIFNLLFIVGLCAMIRPLSVHKSILSRDFPLSILGAVVLVICGLDVFFHEGSVNVVSRVEGLLLLCFFGVFIYATSMAALNDKQEKENGSDVLSWSKSFCYLGFGLAGIIIGGQLVVNGASSLASMLGLGKDLIALTIVAIGTSLPELVTSFVATRKGENDIAMGNVIGSNVFNIFFILGMSATLSPLTITNNTLIDISVLIIGSVIAYIFSRKGTINKKSGIVMLLMYVAYTAYLLMR